MPQLNLSIFLHDNVLFGRLTSWAGVSKYNNLVADFFLPIEIHQWEGKGVSSVRVVANHTPRGARTHASAEKISNNLVALYPVFISFLGLGKRVMPWISPWCPNLLCFYLFVCLKCVSIGYTLARSMEKKKLLGGFCKLASPLSSVAYIYTLRFPASPYPGKFPAFLLPAHTVTYPEFSYCGKFPAFPYCGKFSAFPLPVWVLHTKKLLLGSF